jgi:hypothetical protein
MKKKSFITILCLITLILTGCAAARAPEVAMDQAFEAGGAPMEEYEESSVDEDRSSYSTSSYGGEAAPIEPLVIRNASLSLVVENPSQSADDISQIAESMGGFVVRSNIYQATYGSSQVPTTRASVTIRVPAEKLDETLDQIVADALEVQEKNVSGQDVTREYVDLQSRLRNLEAAEEQLLQIMDNTTDSEDVLRVFQELSDVREEIEVIKGQINYYEDSARLSSISIELIPDVLAQPLQIGGWRPEGTAKDAIETLVSTLTFLGDAGIWLVICVAPIALLLGVPGYFIGRTILRRRRAKAQEGLEEDQ